jgi:UDP-N-acetyl-D-glucosamine dehydrogenase
MIKLEQKIKTKRAKVVILGMGYVGVPHSVLMAKAGFLVSGIDIQKKRVDSLNRGKSYIGDVKDKELKGILKNKKFRSFNNFSPLKTADVILICVPTPLDKNKLPDISYIATTAKEIAKYLKRGQLIILESSTYPGTTREIILPELEKTKLKVGKDFFLAYSPERIDPGNKIYKLKDISRVVGGITPKCTRLAAQFYKSFIEAQIMPLNSPEVAEMTKCLENSFRLVNISLVNELSLLCGRMGIDIWEVIEAAKTKPYGFFPFYPSPKVGGHCIPLDPFYLSYKAKEYNFWTRFIEMAGEVNEQMPHFVMTKVIWVLNLKEKPVRGSKVLVWGVSYKKDMGDTRESAAFDIIADLVRKGAKIDYFDPYVKTFKIKHRILKKYLILKSIKYSLQNVKKYDLVLILTDHSSFDYEKLAKRAKLIVDTRNAIKLRKYKNVFRL